MIQDFYELIINDYTVLLDKVDEIERIFRHSKAYNVFLRYLKETVKIRKCDFFISEEEYKELDFVDNKIDIEMHHQVRLFELVLIAGQYLLDRIDTNNGEYITVYDVVNELVIMHFSDYLPFVMMSTTIHQLYHKGLYTIKVNDSVHLGDYTGFINRYKDYITDHIVNEYMELGLDISGLLKDGDNNVSDK